MVRSAALPHLSVADSLIYTITRIGFDNTTPADIFAFAVIDPEKTPRKIVERTLPLRQLADQSVDVEPQQRTLVVVILGASPAGPQDYPLW